VTTIDEARGVSRTRTGDAPILLDLATPDTPPEHQLRVTHAIRGRGKGRGVAITQAADGSIQFVPLARPEDEAA